jgi:hypothetical protein
MPAMRSAVGREHRGPASSSLVETQWVDAGEESAPVWREACCSAAGTKEAG